MVAKAKKEKAKPLTDAEWRAYVLAQREQGNELAPNVRSRCANITLMLPKAMIEAIEKEVSTNPLYDSVEEWVAETLRTRLKRGQ